MLGPRTPSHEEVDCVQMRSAGVCCREADTRLPMLQLTFSVDFDPKSPAGAPAAMSPRKSDAALAGLLTIGLRAAGGASKAFTEINLPVLEPAS